MNVTRRIGVGIALFTGIGLGAGTAPSHAAVVPGFALIPAGSFEMGDHHGFVDPKHGGDETPLHPVRLDAFYMGINDVTNKEYCDFLNSALARKQIEVRKGGVYLVGGNDLLCETRAMSQYSRIGWDGTRFAVLDGKEKHPVVCIRWPGAAVYCNWLSEQKKVPFCYNTSTWDCDLNKSGYRLPTEAEWEYAARGGLQTPYRNFPWGDEPDAAKANWPESKNPFRAGPLPWTTPVGFFNGKLQRKADFAWPGSQETYQTSNGANGYGLNDMAGNVWQLVNDWYVRDYYAYSPAENPPGPQRGNLMPDGKPYRGMRGGNWYNGEYGHSRVSNRNPSYWRGPQDPDHPYYHVGFRVVLPVNAESRPVAKPTPVQHVAREEGMPNGGRHAPQGRGRDATGDDRPPHSDARQANSADSESSSPGNAGSFVLRSSAVKDGGTLPKEFTGDGESATPPLEWSGAPSGTRSYALIMHHIAPDQTKWYWILYNIPADVKSLPKNVKGVGTLGSNSVNDRTEYAPPHSKGPGAKTYILTVYALSAPPQIDVAPSKVSRDVLLAAMKGRILATAKLSVTYTRYTGNANDGPDVEPRKDQAGDRQPRESDQRDGEDRRPPPPQGQERDRSDAGGDRSPRPDDQDRGRRDDRAGGPGGGERRGGGRIAENNKTPTSPNPGQTVGLFLNTSKACPGYTLFAPKHNTVTYLMDNEGRAVHQWKSAYEPGQSVYLKPNGNLLHTCMTKNHSFTGGGEGGRIEEYDWDGKLVWAFSYANDQRQQHHDIAPMPNGNILMLVVEKKSRSECLAAGFSADMLRDGELYPDSVVEIQPVYPDGGKVVWVWHVWDHLIQDFDKTKANYGDVAAHPELIYIRGGRGTPAFWNHANSIAYNAKLDQIVISARGNDEIWFLDHGTTAQEAAGHTGGKHGKGGDLIYRWGNPAAYKRGTASDRQLVQQHDAEWIPDGYPGAGHLTIFNNGYDRGYSSIEEIVPPMDANGRYIIEPDKAYGPVKPAWHYEARNRADFFSSEISGAHRLPNGNTLICAGVVGHLFEVTRAGEMVWQYVNPVVRSGILAQGELPGKDVRGHLFNAVFKVHRYAPDYPGLAGRDLTPKAVIELPASEKGKTGLDKADASPNDRPGDRHGAHEGGGQPRRGSRGDGRSQDDRGHQDQPRGGDTRP